MSLAKIIEVVYRVLVYLECFLTKCIFAPSSRFLQKLLNLGGHISARKYVRLVQLSIYSEKASFLLVEFGLNGITAGDPPEVYWKCLVQHVVST